MSVPAKKIPMYPIVNDASKVKDVEDNYSTGFISLFRSIRDHWIWDDPKKFQWWIDILMECNHVDKKVTIGYELLECKRGQTLHSLLEWSKRWRVDISTVRRFLKLLQNDSMIVVEPLPKTTRITVCKYDSYQQRQHDKDTLSKRDANATQTPSNTNNNDNNDNKILYRHNVSLTKQEHDRLISELGEELVNTVYDYLSNYKIEKNYKTKSDNLTIRRWVIDAVKNGAKKNIQAQQSVFTKQMVD